MRKKNSTTHPTKSILILLKNNWLQKNSILHYYLSSLVLSAIIVYFLVPDLYTQGAEFLYLRVTQALLVIEITLINCCIWILFSRLGTRNKAYTGHLLFITSHCLGLLFISSSLLHFYLFHQHWNLFTITNAYTGIIAGQAPFSIPAAQFVLTVCLFFGSTSILLCISKLVLPRAFLIRQLSKKHHGQFLFLVIVMLVSAQLWMPNTDASKTVSELSPLLPLVKTKNTYPNEDFYLQDLRPKNVVRQKTINNIQTATEKDLAGLDRLIKAPDILFIHIEGFRADMLNEQVTPQLFRFGLRHKIMPNHYSSSNNTPNSVFSILSGLSGDYYQVFRAQPGKILPIELLKKLGYSRNIFHSAPLGYEKLGSIIFNDFSKFSNKFQSYDKKDAASINKYLSELENEKLKPRFDYLVMDSSHFPYYYPEKYEKFTPALKGGFSISSSQFSHLESKKNEVKNRYKNALYYLDSIIGELLNKLENNSLMDNRVVIIFGDHGEEFWEKNRFGHSFSLNNEQTKVAAIIALPDKKEKNIHYNYSNHQDFVPSIFSLLKINGFKQFYNGKDLLKFDKERDFAKVSMGVVGKTKRYEYAAISAGKKIKYSLIDELHILDIAQDDDKPLVNWSHAEVSKMILQSENNVAPYNN